MVSATNWAEALEYLHNDCSSDVLALGSPSSPDPRLRFVHERQFFRRSTAVAVLLNAELAQTVATQIAYQLDYEGICLRLDLAANRASLGS